VIHGTEDEVTPPENGRRLAELIPDARLALLDGAHHGYFLEHPEATDLVLAFLAEQDRRRVPPSA
jgi:pimeloyl-ACP methyl ester carboxylesterase